MHKQSSLQTAGRGSRQTWQSRSHAKALRARRFYDSHHVTASGNGLWRSSEDGKPRVLTDVGGVKQECNTLEHVAIVMGRGRAQPPLIWRWDRRKTLFHQHRMPPSPYLQISKPAKSAGSSGGRGPDAAACVRCGDVAVHSVRHISRPDGSRRHDTLYRLFRKILHQQRLCQIWCKAIVTGRVRQEMFIRQQGIAIVLGHL